MNIVKNICTCLVGGFILFKISAFFETSFLDNFLEANLVTLLIALLAINLTTLSVIVTRLRELHEQKAADFSRTMRSMRWSIAEQLALIAVAVVFQMAKGSTNFFKWDVFIQESIIVVINSVFVCALCILHDTANAVFVLFRFERKT